LSGSSRSRQTSTTGPLALLASGRISRAAPAITNTTTTRSGQLVEQRLRLDEVASALLVVGLLRYRVTIDDDAAARDWIAGTIAAISPGRAHERISTLRPYRPSAQRVYKLSASPTGGTIA
jgi:hypothetical protein